MSQRVQKIIAQWGIASRRRAEELILAGRVRLNGQIAQLGDKADPSCDRLEVDGRVIQNRQRPQLLYLLLNKPVGVVSTCYDPQNRPTVLDCLPADWREGTGIHPVGRLDFNSSGALLLTNDGELTLQLTHPRYHLPKTYEVLVAGHPTESDLQQWREGVMLMGKKTLPAQVTVIQRSYQHTRLQVILSEGRNRQIRRIVQQLGFSVLQLHRTAIGSVQLHPPNHPSLPSGKFRFLSDAERGFLQKRDRPVTALLGS